MRHLKPTLLLSLLVLGCQSSPKVVSSNPDQRAPLFETIAALEGRWEGEAEGGMQPISEFKISSNGSVVRETMFPGQDQEMTNMYSLDGNSIVMTHYCAGGNQPHMRARAVEGNMLVFRTDGVSDLKSADEHYMGEMTLVLVDENTIEQRWKSLKNGKVDHEMVMPLKRVR